MASQNSPRKACRAHALRPSRPSTLHLVTLIILATVATIAVAFFRTLIAFDGQAGQVVRAERPLDLQSDLMFADAVLRSPASLFSRNAYDGQMSVLLAAAPGTSDRLAVRIAAWDGQVEFHDARVGYLRVTVPTSRWVEIRQHPDVASAQLNGPNALVVWTEREGWWRDEVPRRAVESVTTPRGDLEKPLLTESQARAFPYSSDAIMGVDRFRAAHPTFDGRGITIAMVESGASRLPIDHVAFSTALDRFGDPVSKIRDFIVPDEHMGLATARTRISSSDHIVRLDGSAYKLPAQGPFSLGEVRIGFEMYPVLWNLENRTVWVDTSQDHDFTNDAVLRDARDRIAVGSFKRPVPWSSGRFFVTVSRERDTIRVHPVRGNHIAMTASVAAGADTPGNLARGVAPNARLVLVESGRRMSGYLESLILAARHPDVDIISVSTMAVRSTPHSDRFLSSTIVDRIVSQYGKPIIQGAGNSGTWELVDPAGVHATSVGAYLNADMAQAFFGQRPSSLDSVWSYSVRGPQGQGAGKPDIVAPAERISARECDGAGSMAETRLPTCFAVASGTSSSAPQVAALVALLLSGAKQSGLQVDATTWPTILRHSARWMEGWDVAAQGSGVPQADAAWRLLSDVGHSVKPLGSKGPIAHRLTEYISDAPYGLSLYEREGWSVAQDGMRTLTFTGLADGEAGRLRTSWLGNDGTFTAAGALRASTDGKATLPIRIAPKSAGIHAALLNLVDGASGAIRYQQQVTIVVPESFDRRTRTLAYRGRLNTFERADYAFAVPSGAEALKVRVVLSTPAFLQFHEPSGWLYHRGNVAQFGLPVDKPGEYEFTLPNPDTGTWILAIRPYIDDTDAARLDYTVSLELMTFQPRVSVRSIGEETEIELQWPTRRNGSLACDARVTVGESIARDAAFTDDVTPHVETFVVPEGATDVVFRATGLQPKQTLHMYLYSCGGGSCLRYDVVSPAVPQPTVRLRNPQPGRWTVIVTPGPGSPLRGRVRMEQIVAIGALAGPVVRSERRGDQCVTQATISTHRLIGRSSSALVSYGNWPLMTFKGGRDANSGDIVPVGLVVPLSGKITSRFP